MPLPPLGVVRSAAGAGGGGGRPRVLSCGLYHFPTAVEFLQLKGLCTGPSPSWCTVVGVTRTRIDVRLPDGLLARVDVEAVRLGQTRTKFVERALESALNGQGSGDTSSVSSPQRSGSAKETAPTEPSASSRAPDPDAPTTMVEAAKRATLPPGVKTARELALERQRRLNEGKG